jgi:mono/diheme cytochrome c family protein
VRPLVLLVVLAACDSGLARPHPSLERMIDQPRVDPYEPLAIRSRPEGTVPRRLRRSSEPPPTTIELLARGRDRYAIFCSPCHGTNGDGRGRVASAMRLVRPPSLVESGRSREEIQRIVTGGRGLMPAYGSELTPQDAWAVAAYVDALRLSQSTSLAALPAEVRAEAEEALR